MSFAVHPTPAQPIFYSSSRRHDKNNYLSTPLAVVAKISISTQSCLALQQSLFCLSVRLSAPIEHTAPLRCPSQPHLFLFTSPAGRPSPPCVVKPRNLLPDECSITMDPTSRSMFLSSWIILSVSYFISIFPCHRLTISSAGIVSLWFSSSDSFCFHPLLSLPQKTVL